MVPHGGSQWRTRLCNSTSNSSGAWTLWPCKLKVWGRNVPRLPSNSVMPNTGGNSVNRKAGSHSAHHFADILLCLSSHKFWIRNLITSSPRSLSIVASSFKCLKCFMTLERGCSTQKYTDRAKHISSKRQSRLVILRGGAAMTEIDCQNLTNWICSFLNSTRPGDTP